MSLFDQDKKWEFAHYAYYDHAGIARHLEEMARKGWFLEKMGYTFWHYRQGEAAEVRYAVVYFPKSDLSDALVEREQRSFWESCAPLGWEIVTTRGQLQVFRNPDRNAIPIETDPVVQAENIHTAMKAGFLPGKWLTMAYSIFYLAHFSSKDFINRPWLGFLLNPFPILGELCWTALALSTVADILRYHLWHRAAAVTAREEGFLPPLKKSWWHHNKATLEFAVLALLVLGLGFVAGKSRAWMTYLLITLVAMLPAFALTFASQCYCKKRKLNKRGRRKVIGGTLIVGVVCSMALLIAATSFLIKNPSLLGHKVEKRSYMDGSTFQYEVYHDALPLTISDLTGEEALGDYSCHYENESMPWLGKYTGLQTRANPLSTGGPTLHYTVWTVPQGTRRYEAVRAYYFEDLRITRNYWIPQEWQSADAERWGAEEAYQEVQDGELGSAYLLFYPRCVVSVDCSLWEKAAPAEAHIAAIRARLIPSDGN